MYRFKTRLSRSLFIPSIFLLVAVLKVVLLYFPQQSTKVVTAEVIVGLAQVILAIIIGYFAAVIFLSLETIIRMLIRKETTVSTLLQRARGRSLGKNIEVMEQWDMKDSYKLTNSVTFQTILLIIAFYTTMSASALTGVVMVYTLLFLFLTEQATQLLRGGDLNNWYWQIRQTVKRDTQMIIFLLMVVFYLWTFSATLF